ncbi:hypothetical protein [Rubritalea tangerina]|uniref:DUF3108 domain-containing protein n=1 Tax=Rubritalea tangerina TaxID=430798 RepID=A0ABW4ZAX8_9BACT
MIRHLYLFALVSSFLTCLALGQSSKLGKTFYIACWSEWGDESVYIESVQKDSRKKSMVEVGIHPMSYSSPYGYVSGKPIKLYKKTGDPEKPFQVIKSLVIPSKVKKPLVMMVKGKTQWNYQVYDIHPSVFPYGSYKMVNFTSKDIYVKMGEKKLSLKPKQARSVVFSINSVKKAIHCQSWHNENGEMIRVYSNMFMNRSSKRSLMFFYTTVDSRGEAVVRTKSLVDFKPS